MLESAPRGSSKPPVALVSIIIPVYGPIQYLAQAVRSALDQTHPAIEIVVVDDGSPNDPWPVMAPFAQRVRFLRKQNGGQGSARNFGAATAKGDYLLFLDQDDFIESDAVAILLRELRTSPTARWAAGIFFYVNEQGQRLAHRHSGTIESGIVYSQMVHECLIAVPSTVLVETAIFRQLAGFDEAKRLQSAEDYDFWIRLAKTSPVVALQRPVTNYRVHPQQVSKTCRAQHVLACIEVLRKHREQAPAEEVLAFDRTLARVCKELGDEFYVADQPKNARQIWRTALVFGPWLAGWKMRFRFFKSRLPVPVLRLLRRVAKCVRESRLTN
jgi:Glycosyl transferase family 2